MNYILLMKELINKFNKYYDNPTSFNNNLNIYRSKIFTKNKNKFDILNFEKMLSSKLY